MFQNVPTMIESGIPDYELIGWLAVFAPANTPQNLVGTLNGALVAAINSPGFAKFTAETAAMPSTCSPSELANLVKTDSDRWKMLVDIAKIEKQ
jgi:tripartite-type tricarboxylate transporter receptor subunit TctC